MRILARAVVPVLLAPGLLAGQTPDSLPEGVTPAMITEGRELFHGAAVCLSCHGQDGRGVRGIGPALGDSTWIHSDGAFGAIVEQIRAGVPSDASTSGIMMPPMGGARLSDEQLRAIAAYVWSLRYTRS